MTPEPTGTFEGWWATPIQGQENWSPKEMAEAAYHAGAAGNRTLLAEVRHFLTTPVSFMPAHMTETRDNQFTLHGRTPDDHMKLLQAVNTALAPRPPREER